MAAKAAAARHQVPQRVVDEVIEQQQSLMQAIVRQLVVIALSEAASRGRVPMPVAVIMRKPTAAQRRTAQLQTAASAIHCLRATAGG